MNEKVSIASGHGATNTVNDTEYYELICSTCRHIYDVLTAHCGPYATDALIITENNRNLKDRHYAIFTKDGINIVRSIEFVSPIQKHIQSLIAYIGERVDSLSHDGTTTSMMLFSKLVELYFEELITSEKNHSKTNKYPAKRSYTKDSILNFLKVWMEKLKGDVITVDRLATDFNLSKIEALKFVSYHQAMLSSKGDVELAKAITEVVETLPVELYGLFSVSQSGIESDKRFTVLVDDFNYRLPVLSNPDDMNHNMRTEYLAEVCDLIVCEDDLVPGNPALEVLVNHVSKFNAAINPTQFDCEDIDIETGAITIKDANDELKDIEPGTPIKLAVNSNPLKDGMWIYNGPNVPLTRPKEKKDLVIIAKSVDGSLMAQIQKVNRSSKNKIVIYTMSVPNPYSSTCTILDALINTAGVYHLEEYLVDNSLPYLIQDAKVHFKNRRLYVSNLYKKDGSQYHPFHNDPTLFEPYTKMVTQIKTALDEFTSGKLRFESAQDRARYEDYIEIYRRMICAEVRNLQISGLTHDVLADKDVLQDSFGAVLSSLESGFVLDGYLKLNSYFEYEGESFYSKSLFRTAFKNILESTHRKSSGELDDLLSNLKSMQLFDNKTGIVSYAYWYLPAGKPLTSLVINKDDMMSVIDLNGNKTTLVMQPADTYRELFKRLTDLLPKLINTNRAIIPGTVNESTQK